MAKRLDKKETVTVEELLVLKSYEFADIVSLLEKKMLLLEVYRSYLQKNIVIPCELTGNENFRWEEFYIIGLAIETGTGKANGFASRLGPYIRG
jgi:hypothetical protein